jgi:hypothetical protein
MYVTTASTLNFSPNGVRGPPPFAAVWQSPHAFPVSLANCAVAAAGLEITYDAAPTITAAAAVLQARTKALLA